MRSKCTWALVGAFLLASVEPAFSQETNSPDDPPSSGWRKFGEPGVAEQPPGPAYPVLPPELTLPAGTWIKIRVDQPLSSDRNHPGDQFTATLVQPLIVDGFVIARAGQTVGGQVTSVEKAGRIKGTSRMGLELTELGLADGSQVPIRSQLIEYIGGTSKGRDAAAVAGTTATGAAIGAIADGGFGAGVGALAGAAAGAIGVLVTRGRPTVVYPEAVVTFRIVEPLAIATRSGERAFLPAGPQDYGQPALERRVTLPAPNYPPAYAPYPLYAPYAPYPYWAWGGGWGFWPGWYGPSVFVFHSHGWGHHGWHH